MLVAGMLYPFWIVPHCHEKRAADSMGGHAGSLGPMEIQKAGQNDLCGGSPRQT
jgi:hypothetical protein